MLVCRITTTWLICSAYEQLNSTSSAVVFAAKPEAKSVPFIAAEDVDVDVEVDVVVVVVVVVSPFNSSDCSGRRKDHIPPLAVCTAPRTIHPWKGFASEWRDVRVCEPSLASLCGSPIVTVCAGNVDLFT